MYVVTKLFPFQLHRAKSFHYFILQHNNTMTNDCQLEASLEIAGRNKRQ